MAGCAGYSSRLHDFVIHMSTLKLKRLYQTVQSIKSKESVQLERPHFDWILRTTLPTCLCFPKLKEFQMLPR